MYSTERSEARDHINLGCAQEESPNDERVPKRVRKRGAAGSPTTPSTTFSIEILPAVFGTAQSAFPSATQRSIQSPIGRRLARASQK